MTNTAGKSLSATGLAVLGGLVLALIVGIFWFVMNQRMGAAPAADPVAREAAAGGPATTTGVHDAQIVGMVEGLAEKLRKEPENGPAWAMLARSYGVLGRYAEATTAYRQAAQRLTPDATLLADWADALAMANKGQWNEEGEKLIRQALTLDGRHVKALALAGTAAYRRQDYRGALDFWRRGLAAAAGDPEWRELLEASIRDAEGMLKAR